MSDSKCQTCGRTTETHAPGCSVSECPNRRPQVWGGHEGAQGFPGSLAEDRIVRRRAELDRCEAVDLDDL